MKSKMKLNMSKQSIIFIGMLLTVFVFVIFVLKGNLNDILADTVIPAIFALGMGVIFSVGGFDLSVGHIASLSALLVAFLMSPAVYLVPSAAILIGLGVACIIGAISGLIVSRLGVSSFIATLSIQFIITGVRQQVTGGRAIYISHEGFKELAGRTAGVSHLLISLLVVGVLCYFFMERSTVGRKMQFIGSNINASEYKGVDVRNLTVLAFVIGAALAAFAGMLFAARASIVQINSVDNFLLDAITIAVLSKVLFGGKYRTLGIIAVAFLISMLGTGIIMCGFKAEWVVFAKGLIIVLSIFLSKIK